MPSPLTLQRALETLAAYSPENPPLSSSDHYFFNEAAWLLRDHYAQVVERTRRRLGTAQALGDRSAAHEMRLVLALLMDETIEPAG